MKNVVIIGFGPAGISAAIYLKRMGIQPTVIGKDYGALSQYPEKIENYYGFENPIYGKDLIASGINQAKRLGIELVEDAVIALEKFEDYFYIKSTKQVFKAKSVILATGKQRITLPIKGFHQFKGKGISLCAQCDGYFFRRKKVAVIGCGPYMAHELNFLSSINKNILVFTNGKSLEQDIDFPVIDTPIDAFVGDNKLKGISTVDGKTYFIDGAFIALGAPTSLEFATKLGLLTEKNNLVVDQKYQTNIDGLFAIGDMIGGKLQIAKAVYDGMMVSDHIKTYLNKKNHLS